MTSARFSVLCLDMAGTTVADDDSVMNAFAAKYPDPRRAHRLRSTTLHCQADSAHAARNGAVIFQPPERKETLADACRSPAMTRDEVRLS